MKIKFSSINLFLTLCLGLLFFSCTSKKIDPNDYPIIITIGEIEKLYEYELDTSMTYQSAQIVKYWEGGADLEYEYDYPETEEYLGIYYSYTLAKASSEKEARNNFKLGKMISDKILDAKSNVELVEYEIEDLEKRKDVLDEYYYAFMEEDGEAFGMVLSILFGKTTLDLFLTGVVLEDDAILLDLILPKMEAIKAFDF